VPQFADLSRVAAFKINARIVIVFPDWTKFDDRSMIDRLGDSPGRTAVAARRRDPS